MKFRVRSIIKKAVFISVFALIPTLGYSAAWTSYYQLENVYPASNGNVFVSFSPRSSHINPDACTVSAWYVMTPNNLGKDNIYKLLLTGIASGKRVRLYIDGCVGSYPKILHANIRND